MHPQAPASGLEITLFGGLAVRRDGEVQPLPPSRKTRALLGYLILKGAPQRRDALCDLFWDLPDDPRASLRWSLSKLRPVVNGDGAERLVADRERIGFSRMGATVDALALETACAQPGRPSEEALIALAEACSGTLLAGLDLPDHPAYEAWRLAQQERGRQLRLRLLHELLGRSGLDAAGRTRFLRMRLELDPGCEEAHAQLLLHLRWAGGVGEAEAQAVISRRMLEATGTRPGPLFRDAARGASTSLPVVPAPAALEPATQFRQAIRFCTSQDGTRLAFATSGQGRPLVKTANWLNHLEFDWESPLWRHVFRALSNHHTLVRYDSRGNGLSDWAAADLSLDAMVEDLRAVVDAAGLDRFPLLAISQGCAVAVEFAVRWPERVSRLVLHGGYARGWRRRGTPESIAQREAMITLVRTGWGQDNPAFRQVFTSLFAPDATPEQVDWLNELQRVTTSPENAARIMEAFGDLDVSGRLHRVSQPTLVLHSRGDARIPHEEGRDLAAGIPGSRFITLEGRNHLLLEHDPQSRRFLEEVEAFLEG